MTLLLKEFVEIRIHFPTIAAGGSGLIHLFWIGWHRSRLTLARSEVRCSTIFRLSRCWIYWICIDDGRAFTSNGLLSSTGGVRICALEFYLASIYLPQNRANGIEFHVGSFR